MQGGNLLEQENVDVLGGPKEHMVRHIGFAERWLARAKREVAEGNLARSLLTLLLAEAEVHHAREANAPSPRSAVPPRLPAVPAILGAAGLAALLVALSIFPPRGEIVEGIYPAPPVIRFNQQVGTTLALVSAVIAPSQHLQAADPASPARQARPMEASPAGGERTSRVMPRLAARRVQSTQARPAPSVPETVTPSLVSDGDLLDLILTAERSLRREKR